MRADKPSILTVNAGSSSLRLARYRRDGGGAPLAAERDAGDALSTARLRRFVGQNEIACVAHRVVHGGDRLTAPTFIDAGVEAEIARCAAFAPLHNPIALAGIRAARAACGDVPQVAVFDTALYTSLPDVARRYALPASLAAVNVRYGFHGLAHAALLERWRALAATPNPTARVISLQLGAGCSVTAFRGTQPVDTSMGFSPLEGLMMATRAGDVDAGLLLHLLRELGFSPDRLEAVLNKESGLLGVSGVSADMRALLASDQPTARQAIELYVYRARKYLGAFLAILGGADAILFGGGVGEHAPAIRAGIVREFAWAGIELDTARNAHAVDGDQRIHRDASATQIWVIATDEAGLMARAAADLLDARTR